MNTKKVGALVIAFSAAFTGTAFAHSGSAYCGHSTTGVIHRSAWVYSWTDSLGRHRHLVQQSHLFTTTSRYVSPVC